MAQNQLGVLHTNSAYITSVPLLPRISEDVKLNRLKIYIRNLKIKEDAFAQRFGYNTIEDFIKGIRDILQMNPADMKALQQFSSNNLQRHLEQFKRANSNMFINQPIKITLKGDSEKLGKLFNAHGGNGSINWSISSPDTLILAQWDTKLIKDYVNKLSGTHFHTGSESTDLLIDFLTNKATDMIQVSVGNQQESIEEFMVNHAVSPFELKPSDFKKLVQNNPQLAEELRARITYFVQNDLCAGASQEFKNAVQTVAGQKFTDLSTIAFFMGGKGWSTQSLGAFGELQTVIMFQYIANKTPNKIMAAKISQLIGDQLNNYSQQLHTDIEIFNAFGIQVKNYGSAFDYKTGMEKTVNVNLHPTEIASLGASEGVVDYIVNSYFNTSIAKYPEADLNAFFESHASELLNLDLNVNIPDQVSFYMIGSNFIPGSVILEEAFYNLTIKVNSSISGKEGGDDTYYMENPKKWHNKFAKWWENTSNPLEVGEFEPTGRNDIGAWDRNVSITTSFTYNAIFDGLYKLF